MTEHKCVFPDSKSYNGDDPEQYRWGSAITECYSVESGKMYVDNGEYNTQVNFCPLCGFEALVKI